MATQHEYLTDAFAFINNNKSVLAKSSSGGFFSAIAEWTFVNNGIVYGCEYDEHFNAVFRKAESTEELVAMRGSKYVESKAWPVFSIIKQSLKNNRIVLFIALPCQIAGLLSTLDESEKQNLITVDILCHGVPSHKLFESYIQELAYEKGPILEYHFRNKKYWGWGSWGTYSYRTNGKNKEKKLLVANDYYYSLYFKENNYRESCYRCQYASLPRLSDITIGDCWNIEEIDSTIKSKDGVSLILVNSNKGKKIFDEIRSFHFSLPIRMDDAKKYNKTITLPAKRPDQRNDFYSEFNKLGFKNAASKYCKLRHILPVIARYLPRNLKKRIKRIIKGE
jgi:coenzyme F420-reducing hydrogenase beta subunit